MQKIPQFLQSYLASYDLNLLDPQKNKQLIITAILNKGDDKALQWLSTIYSKEDIEQVIKNPTRGMWYSWILNYWTRILNISLPKGRLEQAQIRL